MTALNQKMLKKKLSFKLCYLTMSKNESIQHSIKKKENML